MIKKIFLVLIIIVLASLFWFFRGKTDSGIKTNTGLDQQPTNTETEDLNKNEVIVPDVKKLDVNISKSPKDIAWDHFQKYLSYNQSLKLDQVKSAVYKISPVCDIQFANPECIDRMNAAYSYGKELKKEDFAKVWSDKKQIVLATEFKLETEGEAIRRGRSILFFIYTEGGELKLLSFSPFKGAVIGKGTASDQELIDKVTTYTNDQDEDGMPDYDEECLGTTNTDCVKTNPKIRDTDQNGWWDGVQALMK